MWDNQMWDEKKQFTEWFTSYSAASRKIPARTAQELGMVVDRGRTEHRTTPTAHTSQTYTETTTVTER